MYYNVEPLHFGTEQVTFDIPKELYKPRIEVSNPKPLGYAVMLDDTRSPGVAVMELEARTFLAAMKAFPSVFLLETHLIPIACALLALCDPLQLSLRNNRLYIQTLDDSLMLGKGVKLKELGTFLAASNKVLFENKDADFIPTCPLFTLSWYTFRLLTSWEAWSFLSQNPGRQHLNKAIRDAAHQSLANPIQNSVVCTLLQEMWRPNEKRTHDLAESLLDSKIKTLLLDPSIIINDFF